MPAMEGNRSCCLILPETLLNWLSRFGRDIKTTVNMKILVSLAALCLAMFLLTSSANGSSRQANEPGLSESEKNENPAYVSGLTSGRTRSLVGGVIGLVSVIIGWRARSRSVANKSRARTPGISACVLGIVAIALSVVHLAGNTGGFGTGGGKAGAIVALVLGIIGTFLGGISMRTSPGRC